MPVTLPALHGLAIARRALPLSTALRHRISAVRFTSLRFLSRTVT